MKKLLTCFLTIGSISLLVLSSCKKNDAKITTNGGTPGALTASATTLVLDKTQLTSTTAAITFTSSAPKYSFNAATTNTLQIDVAGDNWKNPNSVALSTKVYTQSYTTSEFNSMLLKMNLPAGQSTTINVRIQYALSASEITYSNVVAVAVTPFNLASWVYVPGDYEGWNNSSAADSLLSATSNGIFTGIINYPAGGTFQFKIVPVKGSWTVAYGDAGGGTISTSGGNLTVPAAGEYIVTVNFNTNTITEVPADYYSVTGDAALGWGVDSFMKFINDGNDNWVITLPLASTGAFKIRQDAQWSNSWGTSSTTGVLTDASGGNISIATTGNYQVTFNMAPSAYGSPAVATAAYTVTAK